MNKFTERLKGAWRSWTIWINSVAAIVLMALPDLQMVFPQIQGYIPEIYYKYAMGVIIAANILLRFKTTKDLADIKPAKEDIK